MNAWIRMIAAALCMFIFASLSKPALLLAEPTPEETRAILEKSLSVVEIDKEIARIEQQQRDIAARLTSLERELLDKDRLVAEKRGQAGAVLRAYYMGDRDVLLSALFSTKNWNDMLLMWEYYNIIVEHDHKLLHTYMADYRQVRELDEQLQATQAELGALKTSLLAQRERVLGLQSDIDNALAQSADPETMKRLIAELSEFWQNIGIREVRQYFEALASVMQDLPEMITSDKDSLSIDGLNYTVQVKDDQLNAFLRSKNNLFDNFAFAFEQDRLVATGKRNDIIVAIQGHYTVEEEPQNSILFHVDHLLFNGLELPDTTRRSLEEQFDLGFYPKQIMPFLKATEVQIEDGLMKVKLTLNL
ncbi:MULTISPECIES: hypothetical protein [unclassified Paenibacillus]|uniref:coiled-coil domain-containing protein n=1 Tax=unclassified Paenibacillus TaxID=185978 RepID=UPI001C10BEE6|nr:MULTISPECIES: hypothetical protein [unclassified Paenibacillus]MBU5440496.1 hypothetical protein [Paenibacillus sp. MSJ-34]CAH0119581.1 hypothetical protein PAE9249_02085 [Paenibacillus sp. CECT 9249]